MTIRIKRHFINLDIIAREAGYQNHTVAFWHNDILSTFFAYRKQRYAIMVSQSKDGQIATDIGNKCSNITFIRGSASRGASKALLQLIKLMKQENMPAALTVDGPRGPRHIVKPGIIELAKMTETCLIPVVCYPSRSYIFKKSWDKFRLPLPFSTIHVGAGKPIILPNNLSRSEYNEIQDKIKNELLSLEEYLKAKIL